MGCINSKVMIGRSMSIRDDLNQGFHNSPSISWEELLITSQSGTDQLFALVCSTTNKPRTSNATPSTENPETDTYDNMLSLRDKSPTTTGGSRSFHTVEEYDALLENIRKFSTRSIQHFDDQNSDDVVVDEDEKQVETGWKRKTVAKGLKPLHVSTTIEFPDVARSSLQREQIGDSPGTYVTPKFGSYNNKRASSKIRENENSVFSRELVTAFEDCMKQLRDDEVSILWEMDGYSENRD